MNQPIWLSETGRRAAPPPSMQLGVYLPVDVVFPDCGSTIEELKTQLGKLSRTDALIWCARLNLIVSNATHHDHFVKQGTAIRTIFGEDEISKIASFLNGLSEGQHASVFFRSQLLELMQWIALYCDDMPDDGTTFDVPDVRLAFGKAALIAAELWGAREIMQERLT